MIFKKVLEENQRVCPECGHHYRVDARTRIKQLCDPDTFEEFNAELVSTNPLDWTDSKPYEARQADARQKTGLTEAVLTGRAYVKGRAAILAVMDPFFIMNIGLDAIKASAPTEAPFRPNQRVSIRYCTVTNNAKNNAGPARRA